MTKRITGQVVDIDGMTTRPGGTETEFLHVTVKVKDVDAEGDLWRTSPVFVPWEGDDVRARIRKSLKDQAGPLLNNVLGAAFVEQTLDMWTDGLMKAVDRG